MSLGPSIDLSIGGGGGAGEPPIITVVDGGTQPIPYSYITGDELETNPDYVALTSPLNYESSEGTITAVEWQVDGVNQSKDYVLSEGENVVLVVSDSVANMRQWSIDASVDGVVPDAPTSLVATGADSKVNLTWIAPVDPGSAPITGYFIERSVDGGAFSTLVPNTGNTDTIYEDLAVTNGTLYAYRVSAINSVGTGPASIADSATPQAARTIESVVATPNGDNVDIVISSSDAVTGDGVYTVTEPDTATAPTATEIRAGQASGGGDPASSSTSLWNDPISDDVSDVPTGDYITYAVIETQGSTVLSLVGVSNTYTVTNVPTTVDFTDTFLIGTLGYTALGDDIPSNSDGNWLEQITPGVPSVINPDGSAEVGPEGASGNCMNVFGPTIGADHGIEVQYGGNSGIAERNDLRLQVRSSNTTAANNDCVDVFVKNSTNQILFREFIGGVQQGSSQTFEGQLVSDGDLLKLEVIGSTVQLFQDTTGTGTGYVQLGNDLILAGNTGGKPAWGGFIDGPEFYRLNSVRVYEL